MSCAFDSRLLLVPTAALPHVLRCLVQCNLEPASSGVQRCELYAALLLVPSCYCSIQAAPACRWRSGPGLAIAPVAIPLRRRIDERRYWMTWSAFVSRSYQPTVTLRPSISLRSFWASLQQAKKHCLLVLLIIIALSLSKSAVFQTLRLFPRSVAFFDSNPLWFSSVKFRRSCVLYLRATKNDLQNLVSRRLSASH